MYLHSFFYFRRFRDLWSVVVTVGGGGAKLYLRYPNPEKFQSVQVLLLYCPPPKVIMPLICIIIPGQIIRLTDADRFKFITIWFYQVDIYYLIIIMQQTISIRGADLRARLSYILYIIILYYQRYIVVLYTGSINFT